MHERLASGNVRMKMLYDSINFLLFRNEKFGSIVVKATNTIFYFYINLLERVL